MATFDDNLLDILGREPSATGVINAIKEAVYSCYADGKVGANDATARSAAQNAFVKYDGYSATASAISIVPRSDLERLKSVPDKTEWVKGDVIHIAGGTLCGGQITSTTKLYFSVCVGIPISLDVQTATIDFSGLSVITKGGISSYYVDKSGEGAKIPSTAVVEYTFNKFLGTIDFSITHSSAITTFTNIPVIVRFGNGGDNTITLA